MYTKYVKNTHDGAHVPAFLVLSCDELCIYTTLEPQGSPETLRMIQGTTGPLLRKETYYVCAMVKVLVSWGIVINP
jgi:hypothetical protein